MPDKAPSQIFVSLVPFHKADILTASIALFLLFKKAAMMEWDVPNGRAITITDCLTSQSLTTCNLISRSVTRPGLLLATLGVEQSF